MKWTDMRNKPRNGRNTASTARWIATLILFVVAAIFGREQIGRPDRPGAGAPFPPSISGAGRPVDGDSLWVGRDEVRLKGIDAPEGRQSCTRDGAAWACGDAARDQLRNLIGKDVVSCRVEERDQHGRLLAYCAAGGRDLNRGMVSSGMAVAYGGYVREEGEAKASKRGLWASEFTRPRNWRDEHRSGGDRG